MVDDNQYYLQGKKGLRSQAKDRGQSTRCLPAVAPQVWKTKRTLAETEPVSLWGSLKGFTLFYVSINLSTIFIIGLCKGHWGLLRPSPTSNWIEKWFWDRPETTHQLTSSTQGIKSKISVFFLTNNSPVWSGSADDIFGPYILRAGGHQQGRHLQGTETQHQSDRGQTGGDLEGSQGPQPTRLGRAGGGT